MRTTIVIGFLVGIIALLVLAGCGYPSPAELQGEPKEIPADIRGPVDDTQEPMPDDAVSQEDDVETAPEEVVETEAPSELFSAEAFTDGCTLRSPASSINMWKDRQDNLNVDIYEFIRQGPAGCAPTDPEDCDLNCRSVCNSEITGCRQMCDDVRSSFCTGGYGPACAKGCSTIEWTAGAVPCEDQCDDAFDAACSKDELEHCKDSCRSLFVNVCMDKCIQQC